MNIDYARIHLYTIYVCISNMYSCMYVCIYCIYCIIACMFVCYYEYASMSMNSSRSFGVYWSLFSSSFSFRSPLNSVFVPLYSLLILLSATCSYLTSSTSILPCIFMPQHGFQEL